MGMGRDNGEPLPNLELVILGNIEAQSLKDPQRVFRSSVQRQYGPFLHFHRSVSLFKTKSPPHKH